MKRPPLRKPFFGLVLVLALCLTSCYSEWPVLHYSFHHNPVADITEENIYFFLSKSAWLPPKGLSRFPDGGRVKNLFQEVSLYHLQTEGPTLVKLGDFPEITALIGTNRLQWKTSLILTDSVLYYQALPTSWAKEADSVRHTALHQKAVKWYGLDLRKHKIQAYSQQKSDWDQRGKRIPMRQIDSLLQNIPASELGFELSLIQALPESKYIDALIYGKSLSSLGRKAVLEQYVSPLPPGRIQTLIRKMNRHKNQLQGLEQMKYNSIYEAVIPKLEKLLEEKQTNEQ